MPPGVHGLLRARWSPRGFDPRRVLTREALLPLLEAARWAPSSGNTQPSRWLVVLRGEPAHTRLLGCLSRGNQSWAGRAAALLLLVSLDADDTGRDYPMARHDGGQAAAHLTLQAVAEGLHAHQMSGFDPDAVRRELALSELQRPVVVIAVGAVGEPLPDRLAEREAAVRTRLPLSALLLDPGSGRAGT